MAVPDLSEETMETLRKVFARYQELTEVVLYGSRATGVSTSRSDIDLVTRGIQDPYRLGRLALDLEDTNIPQRCDVQAYERIAHSPLKAQIDGEGVCIYRKSPAAQG